MGKVYEALNAELIEFIQSQRMFFVATAPLSALGHVNVSPKGMDSFRVLDERTVAYLDMTGSGVETVSHVKENGRIVLMFCAFEGKPLILRLYGSAKVIHPHDAGWRESISLFPEYISARQIIDVNVDLVQTSCGFGVPLFDFKAERDLLQKWADAKGDAGIKEYWAEKNQMSIDGKQTKIFENLK